MNVNLFAGKRNFTRTYKSTYVHLRVKYVFYI